MEEYNKTEEPAKKKTAKDFLTLFLAIGGLIVGLMLLRYLMGVLHVI